MIPTDRFLFFLIIAAVLLVVIIGMTVQNKKVLKVIAAVMLTIYTLEAVDVFLLPKIGISNSPCINLIPLHSIMEYFQHFSLETAMTEILGNVAAFLPIGLLLPILFEKLRSWKNILLCSLFLSVGIELIQFAEFLITRVSSHVTDIDDVILNFTGGVLGYLLFLAVQAVWKSRFKARVPSGEKQS